MAHAHVSIYLYEYVLPIAYGAAAMPMPLYNDDGDVDDQMPCHLHTSLHFCSTHTHGHTSTGQIHRRRMVRLNNTVHVMYSSINLLFNEPKETVVPGAWCCHRPYQWLLHTSLAHRSYITHAHDIQKFVRALYSRFNIIYIHCM